MTIQKKIITLSLSLMVLVLIAITSEAESDKFERAKKLLVTGIATYNEPLLNDTIKILVQFGKDDPENYLYSHYVAMAYLGLCDMKNFEIEQSAVKKTKKKLKAIRVAIAKKGLPYADKSIELNDNFSDSYRVRGALISNKISGMISGMKNGSLAEEAIDIALQIDENNPMALIENARMYINKPGVLGGDVEKGIVILNSLIKENPGLEKAYINLGMAYIENGDVGKALDTFKSLLEINPENPEAGYFKKKLSSSKK